MSSLLSSIESSGASPRHAKVRIILGCLKEFSQIGRVVPLFTLYSVPKLLPTFVKSLTWTNLVASMQVVANIPFNISTDVVKQLLPMGDIFSEVVLLLQVSIIHFIYYCKFIIIT